MNHEGTSESKLLEPPTMSTPQRTTSSSVDRLSDEIAALRAVQEPLIQRMRAQNVVTGQLLDEAEEIFKRVPEYVAKLHRTQRAMDALSVRTASMRGRCETLQLLLVDDS